MTSLHCEREHHDSCLGFYGGEKCDCLCHVDELAPRRGWAKEGDPHV